LPKDTTSKFVGYLHTIPLMLNVKQGSCEYQLFKVFWSDSTKKSNPGLQTIREYHLFKSIDRTRRGKQTQVSALSGGHSNHDTN